jgi:hypothetical protein
MRSFYRLPLGAATVIAFLAIPSSSTARLTPDDNVVLRWNASLLQAVSSTRFAPMLAARALAVAHTCMYDAWAAYDSTAVGVHWSASLRRPPGEWTDENKSEAVSFAAHAALVDLFPTQTALFDGMLTELGYGSPGQAGLVGISACQAVLAFRHHDGSNQLGDLHAGAYSDYTDYTPVNSVDVIVDPNHWQPLPTATGPQRYVTPHWGHVVPFALTSLASVMPPPPPLYPHGTYIRETNQILHLSATLDDRSKTIAEYWADGPGSVTPPGHWNVFAESISHRDAHSLDQDVKLFFALGNALLDSSIAAWECKRHFDFVRPVTAIHFLRADKPIRAWAGPGLGTRVIDGSEFRSYIPTPAFPDYVSGHSTLSAASAEILRAFTGSDQFGASVTIAAGSSVIEPGITPSSPTTLAWRTFAEAADQAGLSRRYGGIHFESADLNGRAMGRRVGQIVWEKSNRYWHGESGAPSTP